MKEMAARPWGRYDFRSDFHSNFPFDTLSINIVSLDHKSRSQTENSFQNRFEFISSEQSNENRIVKIVKEIRPHLN